MRTRLATDDGDLAALFEFDQASSERVQAENVLLPEIGVEELVFGVPWWCTASAAFSHAIRWEAASADRIAALVCRVRTAYGAGRVAWHKWVELAEIDWFEQVRNECRDRRSIHRVGTGVMMNLRVDPQVTGKSTDLAPASASAVARAGIER